MVTSDHCGEIHVSDLEGLGGVFSGEKGLGVWRPAYDKSAASSWLAGGAYRQQNAGDA
jgi:hypothetical protein